MNLSALLVAVLISGSLSGILFLVGYVAPYWTWTDSQGFDTHTGLWEWCRTSSVEKKERCGILISSGEWPGELKSTGLIFVFQWIKLLQAG